MGNFVSLLSRRQLRLMKCPVLQEKETPEGAGGPSFAETPIRSEKGAVSFLLGF
jgi:hypothetical protein